MSVRRDGAAPASIAVVTHTQMPRPGRLLFQHCAEGIAAFQLIKEGVQRQKPCVSLGTMVVLLIENDTRRRSFLARPRGSQLKRNACDVRFHAGAARHFHGAGSLSGVPVKLDHDERSAVVVEWLLERFAVDPPQALQRRDINGPDAVRSFAAEFEARFAPGGDEPFV